MATATARKSKVYTISLPPELALRAEALAQRDCRTMSELFREAFRSYSAQQARRTLEELGEYAEGRNPKGHAESDVPRLIEQVRAESPRRRSAR
jgi:metal-responsive CopG/Arc/MetJ family transcriptional regulator